MKRIASQIDGSVSVFLIMILAFVFLFTAVLIDYARITAANVQGERLARAGIRSVMSSYDITLRESYGLFAYGNSDSNLIFSKVLNESMHKSGRGDGFNLLPLAQESSPLKWERPIGEYDVFRRQINEEMKYKAPIDFTLELAGKFKPLSASLGETSRTIDLFSQLQPLYDQREEALDRMLAHRRQAAENGRELLRLIMNPASDNWMSYQALGNLSSAADISAQYSDYVSKTYADMYLDKDEYPQYSYQISMYLQRSSEIISQLQAAIAAFCEAHIRLMEQSRTALHEAATFNERMELVLEQSKNEDAKLGYEEAESWDIPEGSKGSVTARLPGIREQGESLLLSSSDLSHLEANIEEQDKSYQMLLGDVTGLPGVLSNASSLYTNASWLTNSVLAASRTTKSYVQNYGTGGVIIAEEGAAIESHRTSDKERKQMEKQGKAKLSEAMELVNNIQKLGQQAGASLERYQKLRQYYDDSIRLNAGLNQEATGGEPSFSDPYAAGSAAMDGMDGIYNAMSSIMNGARDRLFQNEYAALYFQHFDVSSLVSITGGEVNMVQELADQLDPQNQELEYILYGFYNPAGNVAAAYSEIFAMRLGVRTMEGFIEKAGLGNPLAVTAAALLYGLEKAVEDMLLLCLKGSVPLSKYMPAQLTYRDHLRLFMLLHGGGERQLSRMLALIQLNTGIDPAKKYTYASSEVKFGTRLWFLPGVIKAVEYTGGLAGDVSGSTYYREVRADFAY